MIYETFQTLQTPLKSWLFQASVRNCLNCVQNCDDHGLLDYNYYCKQNQQSCISIKNACLIWVCFVQSYHDACNGLLNSTTWCFFTIVRLYWATVFISKSCSLMSPKETSSPRGLCWSSRFSCTWLWLSMKCDSDRCLPSAFRRPLTTKGTGVRMHPATSLLHTWSSELAPLEL